MSLKMLVAVRNMDKGFRITNSQKMNKFPINILEKSQYLL